MALDAAEKTNKKTDQTLTTRSQGFCEGEVCKMLKRDISGNMEIFKFSRQRDSKSHDGRFQFLSMDEAFLHKFKHLSSHRICLLVLSMALSVFGCDEAHLPEQSTLFGNQCSVNQKTFAEDLEFGGATRPPHLQRGLSSNQSNDLCTLC